MKHSISIPLVRVHNISTQSTEKVKKKIIKNTIIYQTLTTEVQVFNFRKCNAMITGSILTISFNDVGSYKILISGAQKVIKIFYPSLLYIMAMRE
jgi:hypothetical protein